MYVRTCIMHGADGDGLGQVDRQTDLDHVFWSAFVLDVETDRQDPLTPNHPRAERSEILLRPISVCLCADVCVCGCVPWYSM